MILFSGVVAVLAFSMLSHGQPMTCSSSDSSRELYQNLCGNPKVAQNLDAKWFTSHSKEWYLEIGNDVARLHLAEIVQGKLLSYNDDFSDMCATCRIFHGEDGQADGKFYGFFNQSADWKCNPSRDDLGVLLCDFSSNSGLSKYKDKGRIYVAFTDNESAITMISCFPNGEVGWFVASSNKVLEDNLRSSVLEHAKSLGFDTEKTTTTLYSDKSCADREYE